MDAAEALKDKGNAAFLDGNDAAAAGHYERAIALLDESQVGEEVRCAQAYKDLRRNLFSNLSNVYLSMKRYDDSCHAAAEALAIDPTFVKASLRFVKARMMAGYAFDAFVYLLRHTRVLVREQGEQGVAAADALSALQELEVKLSAALGVSRLSSGFELVTYDGGVDMISRKRFAPGDVIFAEEKYKTSFDEGGMKALAGGDTVGNTTESIALRFAEHIRPAQKADSQEWRAFKRDFAGAWPRTVDEVDAYTRKRVGDFIRPSFPDLDEAAFGELLMMSLMCRYNCFYTGFFRTCALANHSCNANIAMKYNPATQTVTMTAVKDIAPGELMNVKYLNDAYFLLGLCKRRELLRAWLFWCRCPRCREDNNAATAVQEFVGCAKCKKYSHYPIPAPSREATEADPILVDSPTCANCKEDLAWPADKLQAFYALTECPPNGATAVEAGVWLVEKLTSANALCLHPAHWIYRVLYYLYCLSLDAALQHRLGTIMQQRSGPGARKEAAWDILQPVHLSTTYSHFLSNLQADPTYYDSESRHYNAAGVVSDTILVNTATPTHGSDALRALCTLIELITPFYPNSEMWALHRMICECVLLHVLYQRSLGLPAASLLSTEQAVTLLQRHGPFLGEQAAKRWLHSFHLLRTSISKEDEGNLPNMASVKKAFKLSA